jgi:hypothetical protein
VELDVLYLSSLENLMKEAFDVDQNACATYIRLGNLVIVLVLQV